MRFGTHGKKIVTYFVLVAVKAKINVFLCSVMSVVKIFSLFLNVQEKQLFCFLKPLRKPVSYNSIC
jgi:hypothetical protein